ncbi:hypothetical protein KIPB_008468 [Kipferlia bialata]|uniref:Nitroreductase domain-containing protein n=1 Tax=Kipferlia bialata TaxID=797122 RepID=A0A9K3D2F4_9EUKA|nr:hypothetical protein KIPB_008468 [Kipferlia bialata]|eukprot:g8468.t1
MEAIECIMTRKSIRKLDVTREVSKETLETIVKAGFAAPTAVNARPWHYVVVTNREVLDKFAAVLPYCGFATKASAAIVVCGKTDKFVKAPFAPEYWVQDCSAATENILLAAHALGLGATWSGVFPVEDLIKEVTSILSLDETVVPLSVIPMGYPVEGVNMTPKNKYNPEEVTFVE